MEGRSALEGHPSKTKACPVRCLYESLQAKQRSRSPEAENRNAGPWTRQSRRVQARAQVTQGSGTKALGRRSPLDQSSMRGFNTAMPCTGPPHIHSYRRCQRCPASLGAGSPTLVSSSSAGKETKSSFCTFVLILRVPPRPAHTRGPPHPLLKKADSAFVWPSLYPTTAPFVGPPYSHCTLASLASLASLALLASLPVSLQPYYFSTHPSTTLSSSSAISPSPFSCTRTPASLTPLPLHSTSPALPASPTQLTLQPPPFPTALELH